MKSNHILPVVVTLLGLSSFTGEAVAQGAPASEITMDFSFTGGGELDETGVAGTEIETRIWKASASHSITRGDARYSIGFSAEVIELDFDGSVPLPDELRSLSLDLTGHWKLNDRWSLNSRIQPGFYGDEEIDSNDAFAVNGSVVAIWRASHDWTIMTGVRVSPFSEYAVLPVLSARWQPNSTWLIVLGVPRTEVAYEFTPSTSVFFAGSLEAGSYRVDDVLVARWNGSEVDGDTSLDFREVRVGIGARHSLTEHCKLQVEIGGAFAREWEYEDRGVSFEPDTAGYAAISAVFEF